MREGTVDPRGDEIRRLRIEHGWSQEELAIKVGCRKRTIENAESGKPLYASTIGAIAAALGNVPVNELLKSKPSPSFASPSTFRIQGVAPSQGRVLIGRDDDLVRIHEHLRAAINEQAGGVVVIHGVPGVGKSALMNRLAQDQSLADLFPDGGLWTAVGAAPDLDHSLRVWGQAIKLPADQLLRIHDLVGNLRAALQGRRMLLLVDDVWQDRHAECFRIATAGSVVLYTTRVPDLANRLALTPAAIYALRGLELPQSLQLLAELCPDVVRDHEVLCREMLHDIGGLPLAITVAGKMLQRETAVGNDVEQLLQSIREDARVLFEQPVPPDMVDLLNQTTPNVAAVLKRSTESLDPQQRWCFARLGAFAAAPASFETKFAARCWKLSHEAAKKIADLFADLGLIETAKRGHYQIHPLMKALALHEWDLLDE